VLDVIRAELSAIAKGGVTADELLRGKGQMRGSVVMGLEDTGAKMTRIAKAELVYGELPTVDESCAGSTRSRWTRSANSPPTCTPATRR